MKAHSVFMKKELPKNKKMTIDDLAVMVMEGREETSELARMVANSFESVGKEIAEVKRDITEVKDNLASTRGDVLAMGDRFTTSCFRPRREFANSEFYDLSTRVGILEQKANVKTKK